MNSARAVFALLLPCVAMSSVDGGYRAQRLSSADSGKGASLFVGSLLFCECTAPIC